MKLSVTFLLFFYWFVDAEYPLTKRPIGKFHIKWENDLHERVNLTMAKLNKFDDQIKLVNTFEINTTDLMENFRNLIKSGQKTAEKVQLPQDLMKLIWIKHSEKNLEEKEKDLLKVCKYWSKAGALGVKYEKAMIDNGKVPHELDICVPLE